MRMASIAIATFEGAAKSFDGHWNVGLFSGAMTAAENDVTVIVTVATLERAAEESFA